jgi:hypothetical protein
MAIRPLTQAEIQMFEDRDQKCGLEGPEGGMPPVTEPPICQNKIVNFYEDTQLQKRYPLCELHSKGLK